MTVWLEIHGKAAKVDLPDVSAGLLSVPKALRCMVDGREIAVDACEIGAGVISLLSEGRQRRCVLDGDAVVIDGRRVPFTVVDPRSLQARRASGQGQDGPRAVRAPMPGRVVRVVVSLGQEVALGEPIVVIEAMKMQNELRSPKAGRIARIAVAVGDAVSQGDVLAVVE